VIERCGRRSWTYQEGRRDIWVIESSLVLAPSGAEVLTNEGTKTAFARGYFDAEGGMPQSLEARCYIQLVQKDRSDLQRLRYYLSDIGIVCGRLHNPSVRADPTYWRMFVRAASLHRFLTVVGSWHPRKALLIRDRLQTWPVPKR
jgi:hypothetical protein